MYMHCTCIDVNAHVSIIQTCRVDLVLDSYTYILYIEAKKLYDQRHHKRTQNSLPPSTISDQVQKAFFKQKIEDAN